MPGTLTTHGADRCYKGGLVSGGATASLHTASPPSDGNKVGAAWYGDQVIAEAGFSSSTDTGHRRLTTTARTRFGNVPDPPGNAPGVLALSAGGDYAWYDDIAWSDWAAGRTADIEAGDIKIDVQLAGVEIP